MTPTLSKRQKKDPVLVPVPIDTFMGIDKTRGMRRPTTTTTVQASGPAPSNDALSVTSAPSTFLARHYGDSPVHLPVFEDEIREPFTNFLTDLSWVHDSPLYSADSVSLSSPVASTGSVSLSSPVASTGSVSLSSPVASTAPSTGNFYSSFAPRKKRIPVSFFAMCGSTRPRY
jgi:hypothetical protein